MTSLSAQCASTASLVASIVVHDAPWQAFGYRGCPRRGRFFSGLVSPIKLERETVLLREMWAAGFGTIVRWSSKRKNFRHRERFIAKLMEISVDGLAGALWPTLRFATRRDAIGFLAGASHDYGVADRESEPSVVFLKRCKSNMEQEIPMQWIAGAVFLFAYPNSLVSAIEPALNLARVAENPDCDIELNDAEFLNIITDLLGDLG